MIIEKGQKWEDEIALHGGSKNFRLAPEILEYLGIEESTIRVGVLAGEGKHGRFVAIWAVKKKK